MCDHGDVHVNRVIVVICPQQARCIDPEQTASLFDFSGDEIYIHQIYFHICAWNYFMQEHFINIRFVGINENNTYIHPC